MANFYLFYMEIKMDVSKFQGEKIVYISDNLNEKKHGGSSRSGYDFLMLLMMHYKEVNVISTSKIKRFPKRIWNNDLNKIGKYWVIKNKRVFPKLSLRDVLIKIYYFLKDFFKSKEVILSKYFKQDDKVIVFVNSWTYLLNSVDFKGLNYVKKVCIIRGSPESFEHQNETNAAEAINEALEFLYLFDEIISVSDICRQKWTSLMGQKALKMYYLPNSIDEYEVEKYYNSDRANAIKLYSDTDYNIALVGSVQFRKGQDLLLKILPGLVAICPNVKIHVIGVVSKRFGGVEIVDEVKKSEFASHVVFYGHQDNALEHISQADLAILTTRAEAFPRTIAEYMALGKPILTTTVSGIPEMIIERETGFTFDVNNPSTFIEQFKFIYNNENIRNEVAHNGRKYYFNNFSKSSQIKRSKDIFEQISNWKQLNE